MGKKNINIGRREISLSYRRNRSIQIEQSWRKKSLFKTSKRTNIFSTFYHYKFCQRWDRRKRRASSNLFHLQNKTTENLNLRIKEDEFEDTHNNNLWTYYGRLRSNLEEFSWHLQQLRFWRRKYIWCPIEEELDYRLLIQAQQVSVNMKPINFFGVS